jgi:AraC family transcriptional regulator, glycine betaine-responsive activator
VRSPSSSHTVRTFGFYLLPEFPLLPLSCMMDVLRLANYVSDRELYRWCVLTRDGGPVASVAGLRVDGDYSLQKTPRLDVLVVCAGINVNRYHDSRTRAWLRRQHETGTVVGSVATATWVLARAGLLAGRRFTIHWEDLAAFKESFPSQNVTTNLFDIDGSIFTCAGGIAAMDMFLTFVAQDWGVELSAKVAQQFIYATPRNATTTQPTNMAAILGIQHPLILKALKTMESHIENPIDVEDVARKCGVSVRHQERLFHQHLGQSPKAYYQAVRLKRAQELLRSTRLPIVEVAFACGFSSSSHLAKSYRQLFGRNPSEERRAVPFTRVLARETQGFIPVCEKS